MAQDDDRSDGAVEPQRTDPPEGDGISMRPDAPTLAERYQPGVDPEQAARSYTAGFDPGDPTENARRNSRRFLIPAIALSVVMLIFFGAGFTMQLVVPLIGIIVTVGLLVAILLVAFRVGDERRRVRLLGRLMIAQAVVLLVLGVTYFVLASVGFVASVPPV